MEAILTCFCLTSCLCYPGPLPDPVPIVTKHPVTVEQAQPTLPPNYAEALRLVPATGPEFVPVTEASF